MFSFRPYKRSDAKLIASWILTEEDYFKWCAGIIKGYPVTEETLSAYENGISDNKRVFWMMACEDEEPFGFIQIRYPEESSSVVRLGFVIVDDKMRGKGYGKSLLKMAILYSFECLNASKITLGVYENNIRAYKAYASVGFSNTNQSRTERILGKDWVCNEMVLYNSTTSDDFDEDSQLEERMVAGVIKNNSFLYAFQPIVFAKSGEIYAYEALMRAQVDGTNVSPAAILSFASKNGKLYDIEKATLFNVLEKYDRFPEVFGDKKLFINSIPGFQLNDEDYAEFKRRFSKYFKKIFIEITEMTDLKDNELDLLLKRSTEDGIGLAIDDYGTGYSNTASLLKYLPNCVKLDRLLISNVNEDTKKQHFIKGMVEFAHANGFWALAEGVETAAELRTVIDIGIDLIQGYYTSRPSFEIVTEIPSEIRNEIVNMNHKTQTADTRKIIVVKDQPELPLMRLSLEQYTGMLIASEKFTLVGNPKYSADMSIKIKDGCTCELTIEDVCLESIMQLPCIELGKKSNLKLILKGENRLRKVGVFVPSDASLTIEGDGNLFLRVQGVKGYGIGSDYESHFGNITFNGTGSLDILVEADEGIGIGGGKSKGDNSIRILNGTVRVEPACGHSVAIGCVDDCVPIEVDSSNVHLDLKTEQGIGIGCGADEQNTVISNSKINIICAGNGICAIGSIMENSTAGTISVKKTDLSILGNGQKLYLIGAKTGPVNVYMTRSSVNLKGEGNEVMGIGSGNDEGVVTLDHCTVGIKISSGTPKAFGAASSDVKNINGTISTSINE